MPRHPAPQGPVNCPPLAVCGDVNLLSGPIPLTQVVLCPDQSELLPVASRTPPRTISARRHVRPPEIPVPTPFQLWYLAWEQFFCRDFSYGKHAIYPPPHLRGYPTDYSPPAIPNTPVSLSNNH